MTDVMSDLRRDAQVAAMLERADTYQPRPGWRERSECAGKPLEWWYVRNGKCKGERVCESCPVQMDCLAAAIREERDLPNLRDIIGYRCVSARVRRAHIANGGTR